MTTEINQAPSGETIRRALEKVSQNSDAATRKSLTLLAELLAEQAAPGAFADLANEHLAGLLQRLLALVESDAQEEATQILLEPLARTGRLWLMLCAVDVPYLFDAVVGLVRQRVLRFRVVAHPVCNVRVREGRRRLVRGRRQAGAVSLMVFELQSFLPDEGPALLRDLQRLIAGMQQLATDRAALLERFKGLQDFAVADGYGAFWRWLQGGNFEPVAYRCVDIRLREDGELMLFQRPDQIIGFVPEHWRLFPDSGQALCEMPAPYQQRLLRHETVTVVPGDQPSPVSPSDTLLFLALREYIGPELCREHVFAGMLTAQGRVQGNMDLPPLRRRILQVLRSLGVRSQSHDWRKTLELLDGFPTIELFLIQRVELTRIVRALTQLYRDGTVKIVSVPGLAAGWLSLVILLPRPHYSSENMRRMEICLRRYLGTEQLSMSIGDGGADTLTVRVRCPLRPGLEKIDTGCLERVLTRIGRSWEEKCGLLLERRHGAVEGARLAARHLPKLSREYRALVHPRYAVRDIAAIDELQHRPHERFALWGPLPGRNGPYLLQYYGLEALRIGQIMPVLEDLGLEVETNVDFELGSGAARSFIHSIAVRLPACPGCTAPVREALLETLVAVRGGQAESDTLHRLVTTAGMTWRQVGVLRAYRDYLLQLGQPYDQLEIDRALVANPAAAVLLYAYFEARFGGDAAPAAMTAREEGLLPPLRQQMVETLNGISDLRQDTILRTLFNVVDATVRANHFLADDRPERPLALKISSMGVIDMPSPRPLYEIFVHSASMMGIHLRGGKVARGGIRWCDRLEGMRDEVLGLMATQMTKNALIVPVGSKGGFVVRNLPADRETAAARVAQAYEDFIRGLLDLTDNLVDGQPAQDPRLVVFDDPDAYLVVAADKGTARFSDRANAIAARYRYWLGDAFASGGSHGYDHKRLGITARGAWVAVQRHLHELGIDGAERELSMIAIGDMSGDVFGNGLLQSDRVRLLAAFDHRHIFLDPEPDPGRSYRERQRLFALSRSSWADYDAALVSEGGGVYPRDAKNIPLAPQVRRWLGTRQRSISGPGLIRLLLAAPADLLWNGGIGTYVKAEGETHQQVGDRANDEVRIDARQLRVKVVGEGGNLGLTQRARVEYSLGGGRINIDAVDNAGGVACSDREVNLKILMRRLLDAGLLADSEARDRMLEELSDAVCAAVLDDCGKQALCLSLDCARCGDRLESFFAQIEMLAGSGLLDPQAHALPTLKQTLTRSEAALTRPELAILMAYSKMQMYQALLHSELPDSAFGRRSLADYFPEALVARFGETLSGHPLAREIAATVMTNRVINQAGSAMCGRLCRQTGAELSEVVARYLLLDEALCGAGIRDLVTGGGHGWPAERRLAWLLGFEKTLEEMCRWALVRNLDMPLTSSTSDAFRRDIRSYLEILERILPDSARRELAAQVQSLIADGFEEAPARICAALPHLEDFLPVANLALATGEDLLSMATLLAEVKAQLGVPEIVEQLGRVQALERWDRLAWQTLYSKFASLGFEVAQAVWHECGGDCRLFLSRRRTRMRVLGEQQARLRGSTPPDYHPFVVLTGTLESLLGPGDREKSGQRPESVL